MTYIKIFLIGFCTFTWNICLAQNDDIEVTDSTSTGWDDDITGGGLNPHIPDEPVTSLNISQSVLMLESGKHVRLVATVNPRAKNKKILWSSADGNIASVEEDGTVTGRALGKTTITATAAGNTSLKRTCKVTIIPKKPRIAPYNVVLPNVPFEFFYDARNYDPDDHCIVNHEYANLNDAQLKLTENLPAVIEDGKALRISNRCEGYIDRWEKGSDESGTHFYRQGVDCMTIVTKVSPRLFDGSYGCDFISNRGGGYNYMFRVGEGGGFLLHTQDAYDPERTLRLLPDEPQVIAVRVDGVNDFILLQNLTTKEELRVDGVHWGGDNNVFKVFYNDGGEYFLGDFYWVYYSFELLTDNQLDLFGSNDFEDGINAPYQTSSADNIYDLSGRKISQPLGKGIYIIANKKILKR